MKAEKFKLNFLKVTSISKFRNTSMKRIKKYWHPENKQFKNTKPC